MRNKIVYIIKILVPIILLSIIFIKIDFEKLAKNFLNVNLFYCMAGILVGYVSQIFIATWRWKFMLSKFYLIRLPYLRLVNYWWIGMFLGYFVPAGMGMDIYRIVSVGQHGGDYGKSIAAVVGEKIFGVLGSILLLMVAYPLVRQTINADPRITEIIAYVYWVGVVSTVCLVLAVVFVRVRHGNKVLFYAQEKLTLRIKRIISKISQDRANNLNDLYLSRIVKGFFHWQNILTVIAFTVMMRLVMAVGGNILFRAVGIQFPLIVNIFTTTLMFIIFTLPISFGTLGVREGTYIVLFSLFGVESETALTVSFLALAGLLLGTLTGGVILLISNIRQKKQPERLNSQIK